MFRAAVEQGTDSTTPLITVLGSLFENAFHSAALKYEHNKVKAKAAYQANLEKKMGDLSKTFPAYAETNMKAKKNTEKGLALLDQKLADYQKTQVDLLSAVPGILQASSTSMPTAKEREQMEMVRRCISVCEVFKSNVDDLKERFEKHKARTLRREEVYQSMDSKIDYRAGQIKDLSSQMESTHTRCSKLGDKHAEFRDVVKSLTTETRSSLAAMKIDLDQCTERDKQNKTSVDNAADKADKVSERLDMLEMRFQTFLKYESIHTTKADELEKLAGDHSTQLQQIQATASHNEHVGDAVNLMEEELQGLRQRLLEVQNRKPSPPP
jgi:hypothetical protein